MKRYNCKNTSGEEMPAFGIGKLKVVGSRTGMSNAIQFEIGKPDGEDGIFVVNGPVPLADDGVRGMIAWDAAAAVLVDSGETVALNTVIGPVADSWACSTSGTGYVCQSAKESDDVVPVHYVPAVSPASGGSGDCGCGCTCADGWDVVLSDGTKTTKYMRWTLVADVEITVTNGHIWLPAGNYDLEYESSTNATWSLDVSSSLRARYTDSVDSETGEITRGDEVTVGVTKSGSMTLNRYDPADSEFSKAVIEITGTVPAPGP
ncbi:MAG: hypothetical protein E6Q97_09360 [Desulfurellales bacterium]|nr:MAG: hypothetical protein E6Q97_09360 [Desulfurellales bacterium]